MSSDSAAEARNGRTARTKIRTQKKKTLARKPGLSRAILRPHGAHSAHSSLPSSPPSFSDSSSPPSPSSSFASDPSAQASTLRWSDAFPAR